MAKVIFNRREIKIWYGRRASKKISDALNLIGGHLGGYGIDLVSETGSDLSTKEYQFQYSGPPDTFKIGARVRTAESLTERDFTMDAIKNRRQDVVGTVVKEHNSHGLCYDVYHDRDGSIGCYDPDELALID